MKLLSVFFMLILLISCEEKAPPKVVMIPKIEITEAGKIIPIDSARIASLKDSSVMVFYNAIQNKTFWMMDSTRVKIISLFNHVQDDGLFPKDFDLKKIQNSEENIKNLSNSDLVDYDILLTENLSRYVEKVSKGSLNPNKLYTNWELKENNINFKTLLLNFQKKDSFDYAVNEASPNHLVYKRLKTALKILNDLPKDHFKKIEIKNKIELNDSNPALIDIKKKLIFWGDLKPLDTVTPVYDEATELGVKIFQMRHGLAPDGVIGIGTTGALNFTKEQRKKQIIANMERWRWYPRAFENEYLIINIPDYTLRVVKNSDTLRTHKVIIGRAARKTPVLSSKLTHLIFNPTWTVPPTILRKDVIPAAARNRGYFSSKNITIYDSNNKVVSAGNWSINRARSYRYVQSPGSANALGLVKFVFPNRFTVYLHDTNTRGFFEKDIRALSSGCIRVENPFELTEYLLDDPEKWNSEQITEAINTGKTTQVNLNKAIYIHIFYWTAWSENGSLQFRDDLYNLDMDLYKKLD
ncbi:murein L,D-transpeptidase [Lutibacter sp.]|uniref:L,D-transpeptidase family protein n=1 Tax=Lutibacter sp. TaxID=1925666 RepID=UPI0035646478